MGTFKAQIFLCHNWIFPENSDIDDCNDNDNIDAIFIWLGQPARDAMPTACRLKALDLSHAAWSTGQQYDGDDDDGDDNDDDDGDYDTYDT